MSEVFPDTYCSTLTIAEVIREHAGDYSVTINNVHGTDEHQFTVTVTGNNN